MEKLENKIPAKKTNYIQWVTVFSAFLLMLQVGLFAGWTSPNFAWLISAKSPIKASTSDLSWIATLSAVASSVGAIFGSVCMEYIGTRKTLLFTHLFLCINWICILIADSVEWVYFARITGSIPVAVITSCSCMYIGETLSSEIRGPSVSVIHIGSSMGIIITTVAETYISKKVSTSIYLTTAFVGLVLMLCLKDTPYFLVKRNDLKRAMQSIKFYHIDKEAEAELKEIEFFVEKNKSQSLKSKILELRSPVNRKSLFAIFLICGLSMLSGYGILLTYMEIILKSAKFDLIKPEELVIYATLIKIIVAFMVVKLINKAGRRILLTVSSIGTSIAMFTLGLHFYLLSTGIDGKLLQCLPVVSIIMYLIMYSMGYMTVPGIVLSEMFSEQMKSTAVFIASESAPLIHAVIAKAYQPIIDFAGEQYAFWSFSLFSLLGMLCAVFLMVETKGKSFLEIQDKLIEKWGR